jgi:hypothetical protein
MGLLRQLPAALLARYRRALSKSDLERACGPLASQVPGHVKYS